MWADWFLAFWTFGDTLFRERDVRSAAAFITRRAAMTGKTHRIAAILVKKGKRIPESKASVPLKRGFGKGDGSLDKFGIFVYTAA